MRRILTVVPVRSGSSGVPDKNIKPLNGQPLVSYAISAALGVSSIDSVLVSTDSEDYMRVASEWGAATPFRRPEQLAVAKITLVDVLQHALHYFDKEGEHFDAVLSVQATVPLLRTKTIEQVISKFHNEDLESAGTVSEIRQGHPYQAKTVDPQTGIARDFLELPEGTRRYPRQARPALYYFNGAVFLRDRSLLDTIDYATNGLGKEPGTVVMDDEEAVNIDEPADFQYAEMIMRRQLESAN